VNFGLGEEQSVVADLARRVFDRYATVERIKAVEATDERLDREMWLELSKSNLLGVALPAQYGGIGQGLVEVAILLEEQGRRVAPVPLYETIVMGAMPLAEFGTPEQQSTWLPGVAAGDVILTAALEDVGFDANRPPAQANKVKGRWLLSGLLRGVPAAHLASRVLVPARTSDGVGLWLVDPDGRSVERRSMETTNRQLHSDLLLDEAEGELIGDRVDSSMVTWTLDRALVALAALQVGVAEESVRTAAEYTSTRNQFGRPLATFQGVAMRAADAYIDTEAMRVTMMSAAWGLSRGRDARTKVQIAKWWASEGGHRVVHQTQYLHGGIGADIEYPSHRYFLWGMQIGQTLGGAGYSLSNLGRSLAERAS
jgi:alkylation response protein AidB-like acyl-CoA dehydrogenase